MKIGIDLDDTIWKFHENFFKFYNDKFGTNYNINDYNVYDLEKFTGKDRKELQKLFDEYESLKEYEFLPLFNFVKESIYEIDKDSKIYFVTARSNKTEEIVKKRISKYFGEGFDIVFMHDENWNKIEEKVDFCVREEIDLMIDDSYFNLKLCSEKGIKSILIDSPWNKNFEKKENITRVNNWKEIVEIYKKIKKNTFFVYDRVYGKEKIEEKILIDLINSPSIQRLKGISQFGFSEKYYDRKVFTRYEHSVGTLIFLRRMGAGLYEQIAGLLHDVSHTAFSHVVDYVLENYVKEDYQDRIFEDFILNTEIPIIMKENGYDVSKILEIEKFSLLEKDAPDLCADRLDYSLREMKLNGLDVEIFLSHLKKNGEEIVFDDVDIAKSFSLKYIDLNKNHWAGIQARVRYYLLSNVLKKAFEKKIISFEDLKTKEDLAIIDILLKSEEHFIVESFNSFENGINAKYSEEGINLPKKFRYVDPEILVKGKLIRLSAIDFEYKKVLEMEKENSKINNKIEIL